MKQVLCSLFIVCLLTGVTLKQASAQSARGTDTIYTARGASTLITCGSPISTFQIGDGKNADYDYRIVDGNMVFIRPVTANPKPTNLIVREGENIHYMILANNVAYNDKPDLAKLKYVLSRSKGGAVITGATVLESGKPLAEPGKGDKNTSGNVSGLRLSDIPPAETVDIKVDTVAVSKLAEDFGKDHRANHQYEVKVEGVSLGYSQAMTLNNMNYFCYRIRNKSKEPFELVKATLLHKEKKDSVILHSMPLLYKHGPVTIAPKGEASEVFVVPSKTFKKDDEVIIVLESTENKPQIVLYLPASTLPKYMVTK
ncbi:MAG TPA: hypothetical protein VM802_05455 [Chitinophaga sp.]|uniref:hypothetical protein n=1 Tax=Chitinophaga sp. TaxID=1869181 RepID=UPI002CC133A5|nr:hypothetical protein [Chitinophaga sp.]HVI44290.1 hypothetical protein [Chitinophaga sp.]